MTRKLTFAAALLAATVLSGVASATAWNLIAGAIALAVGAVLYLLRRPVTS